MIGKANSHIKRAQKESLLLRELSKLLMQITMDNRELQGIFVNRVKLSPDRSICLVYFYCADGAEGFKKRMPLLILYKPSLRKALATAIPSRYTPELMFKFDRQFEKQQRIENLLEQIKHDENEFVDDSQE